jgi:hypothetical protein
MSESIILCEGFHDRAFWDGWLTHLGCSSDGFKPGTAGFPAPDPWGSEVRGGQFAYRSTSGDFVRVRPCNGKSKILQEARIRVAQRNTKRLVRLIINVDVDTSVANPGTGPTGLRQQDVLYQMQQIDSGASLNVDGEIELDAGATRVALVRWETSDAPGPSLPNEQTLERLVCAAVIAAYPARATAVQNWLGSRPLPPTANPKEYAWSHMAGWYAEHGCDAFYANIWQDTAIANQLELRLRASRAWQVAESLAK